MRRVFQCHGPANVVIRSLNLGLGETQVTQQVKRRVVKLHRRDTQRFCAELLTQRPLVEHKADIKCGFQRAFDFVDFRLTKAVTD